MNRIFKVVRTTPEGRAKVKQLYVFDIAPRIVDSDTAEVLMFNSAGVPPEFVGGAADQIPAGSTLFAQIDAGDVGFIQTEYDQTGDETDPEFDARARKDHATLSAYVIGQKRDQATESGRFGRSRGSQSW